MALLSSDLGSLLGPKWLLFGVRVPSRLKPGQFPGIASGVHSAGRHAVSNPEAKTRSRQAEDEGETGCSKKETERSEQEANEHAKE